MANKNAPTESGLSDRFGTPGQEFAAQASDAMSSAAHSAVDRVDESRADAAERIEGAASAIHRAADRLPGGERVNDLAHATADRLSSAADYVRRNDLNRMRNDVETLVKNNPGPSLLIAAAFGFLIGRAVMRD